ncbi:MAG: response regulator [Treponema sp.]|nr:response regulator [Treponema sp.]
MSFMREKIFLVDDNQANLDQGGSILRTFYEVFPAQSAIRLFEMLNKVIPNLILLDIKMPEMDGYEAIKKLKADERYKNIPVIFLTSKNDPTSEVTGFDLGAADYVYKPFSAPILLKRIDKELLYEKQRKDLLETHEKLKNNLKNMEALVQEEAGTVLRLQDAVFTTVIELVEFRDKYTGGHIERTQLYLRALLDEMIKEGIYINEISGWDIFSVQSSAKLHDVGKIAVPDIILGKNAKLSQREFKLMQSHVTAGIEIIEKIISKMEEHDFLNHALRITGTHHEKWDGSGYPIGLSGHNIPLEGRLMAIADVYDALITERPYKKAFSHKDACAIIEEGSGTHFDPVLVKVFRNTEQEFDRIAKEFTG